MIKAGEIPGARATSSYPLLNQDIHFIKVLGGTSYGLVAEPLDVLYKPITAHKKLADLKNI